MDIKKLFVKKRVSDYVLFSGIIVVGIILDQLTKWLAVKYLKPLYPNAVPFIDGIIRLKYEQNTGAAFSMLSDAPWVFKSVSTVAIIAMLIYLFGFKGGRKLQDVALAMIISGGIGNMIDRIALNYVVDFLDFCFMDFAVFNGADSFVCVGAGLLILSLILDMRDEVLQEKATKSGLSKDVSEDGEE